MLQPTPRGGAFGLRPVVRRGVRESPLPWQASSGLAAMGGMSDILANALESPQRGASHGGVMHIGQLEVPDGSIERFCKTWQIAEFDVFGSVTRHDFRPESDVDVMIEFTPSSRWGMLEFAEMAEQLEQLFGRKVDLVTRRAVQRSTNPYRRDAILQSSQRVYGAG